MRFQSRALTVRLRCFLEVSLPVLCSWVTPGVYLSAFACSAAVTSNLNRHSYPRYPILAFELN